MLKLFNTYGRKMEAFRPVNASVVNVFTCGPSVYKRAHIGNHRTFIFEDILVRYLEYMKFRVVRGMNLTDVEDKAIEESRKKDVPLAYMTDLNIDKFTKEMTILRMKKPEYLSRASESIDTSVKIIKTLLERGIAYRSGKNVYFDPLKFPGFGSLYGLDMDSWPRKKRRFHKDTYRGMVWNRGDFIIWHGCKGRKDVCWETQIGRGRPAWNIQDPSIISRHINETLSLYCGGIDNLIRHHDYTRAILESIRSYPMARYWLHCNHLFVDGKKMSKSRGNICHVEDLLKKGFSPAEIRFFLIYGHYRKRLNFSEGNMIFAVQVLQKLRERIRRVSSSVPTSGQEGENTRRMRILFESNMDNDLDVKGALDALAFFLEESISKHLTRGGYEGFGDTIRNIDSVLQVQL